MKKLILVLTVLAMILMCGCSNTANGKVDAPEVTTTEAPDTTYEVTTEATTTTPEVTTTEPTTTEATTTTEETTTVATTTEATTTVATTVTTTEATVAVEDISGEVYMYAKSSVNVRTKPDADSERVGHLDKGEKVQVTGKAANGWYRIKFEDGEYFVSGSYLTDKKPAETTVTTTASTEPEVVPQTPAQSKSPTAAEVAKDMKLGLNLGNTMEAHFTSGGNYEWPYTVGGNKPKDYERFWGAVETTQKAIDGMRDSGFNTVRIPVYWGNMMENDGKWNINPDYMARVREIVDYCENAGVYSVINIHHFDEFIIHNNDLESCKKIFTTLWTQIAEEFKDYPYTLVFEGYNEYLGGGRYNDNDELVEPSKYDAYKMTNALNQAFVDAVRSTGSNNAERVLIASGYYTNIDNTTSSEFKMPKDSVEDRLMVSVHYVDNAMYWGNKIGTKQWIDYIDNQCDKLDQAFTKKGIPVFLGETTASYPSERFGSNALYSKSSDCLKIVLQELLERGFVPVIWDTNDDFYSRTEFKVKDTANAKVIKDIAKTLG